MFSHDGAFISLQGSLDLVASPEVLAARVERDGCQLGELVSSCTAPHVLPTLHVSLSCLIAKDEVIQLHHLSGTNGFKSVTSKPRPARSK